VEPIKFTVAHVRKKTSESRKRMRKIHIEGLLFVIGVTMIKDNHFVLVRIEIK
jgi:hypothetical protein